MRGELIYDYRHPGVDRNGEPCTARGRVEEARSEHWSVEKLQDFERENQWVIDRMTQRNEPVERIEIVKGLSRQPEQMLSDRDRQVFDRIKRIEGSPGVDDLKGHDSRRLYDAYAHNALERSGGNWRDSIDSTIAKDMLRNGMGFMRTHEAMCHGPNLIGLSGVEVRREARRIVADVQKSLEMKELSKGLELER